MDFQNYGTSLEELNLPESVEVTLEDGTTKVLSLSHMTALLAALSGNVSAFNSITLSTNTTIDTSKELTYVSTEKEVIDVLQSFFRKHHHIQMTMLLLHPEHLLYSFHHIQNIFR